MALDRITPSRYLVPVGVVLALAVAVGVWLVPSSVLDPKAPSVGETRAQVPPTPPEIKSQSVPARRAWMGAGDLLESLRERDQGVAEQTPPPEDNGTGPDPRPPIPTPTTRVNWEYEGLVAQPFGVAALVRINGLQRFIFEGDTLDFEDDPSLPHGTTAVLTEVNRDRIVVRIDGGEQTIPRSDDAPPVRAPQAQALGPRQRS